MARAADPLRQLILWCSRTLNEAARREIDYLREENRVLKSALGKRRIL